MLDFLMISTRSRRGGPVEIYPKFIIKKSSDLMIRGGDFYAVWVEERGLWSQDEDDVTRMVDAELDKYAAENAHRYELPPRVCHMWDSESGVIDAWHKYCQRQMRDSFKMLDEKLMFSNSKVSKKDYASKILPYPLEEGSYDAYEELISTLYNEEERMKLEWAIGAVISGDSKTIQKFLVLYGAVGTGKSTVMNIMEQLFDGYYTTFDSRALGSANNSFALEVFRTNPLVAIQHDGDLSRIEDNTRINSLVSHEIMTVNEKFKSAYATRFKCFLFMGTNKPVRITDSKSGLIRRLIDVSPTGEKVPKSRYNKLVRQIPFELGAIASHCLEVYNENKNMYDDYIPINMMEASNDFYNFMLDSYVIFKKDDGVSLKAAWEMYKQYCENAGVPYPLQYKNFREELKTYFYEFKERATVGEDSGRKRNYFSGFKYQLFGSQSEKKPEEEISENLLELKEQHSILDDFCKDYPAQYANEEEKPIQKWSNVRTTLKTLDTSKVHYLKMPENHIVIDFDISDKDGNKSLEKNLEEASKWPKTYAELSKSGKGIHLHYIYMGDPLLLSRVFDDQIEIKVFTGNSSLRRKLTKCNDFPVASISSGLPLKGDDKMLSFEGLKNEKAIRTMIKKNLNKEYHAYTKPSIDFIKHILDEAYASGVRYDVSDMRGAIFAFAAGSHNNSEYCMRLIGQMKFASEDVLQESETPSIENIEEKLVFFDVEVFPNLFLVNWKVRGKGKPIMRMINPTPSEIEDLIKKPLVGFNNRRYDNHMLYGRLLGYDEMQLFKLSQRIVDNDRNAFFREAYNLSYTDIYDFLSKKQSLKKWEIELGIHHKELGFPWDKPVPKELWIQVSEYCDNDVLATEEVFEHRIGDFTARKILAKIAGMTVNDTTNSLSTKIIFGNDRNPQKEFNYRDMGKMTDDAAHSVVTSNGILFDDFGNPEYTWFDNKGRPIFPGYTFKNGVSNYRGEDPKEGGYVFAKPGIHVNVALLDVESMHPSSIEAENLFGKYTERFSDIKLARVLIKNKKFDEARKLLNGALAEFLADESLADDLSAALKIVINSVYGLTSAKFDNAFRDIRNKDNIVAKRGALFMINLRHEVEDKGYVVAHIKTDSIKIPNADNDIIVFCMDYASMYGYKFVHEATYERMCLVNNAVYIARYALAEDCQKLYGYVPKDNAKHPGEWTATGTQFAVPYIYKTLFTKEPITFSDVCETKSVTSALYLDLNEKLPDVSGYEKELDTLTKKKVKDENDISRMEWLKTEIEKGHSYHFVGKVGEFCPVKEGYNGGVLLRDSTNSSKTGEKTYAAATGTTGYRWLESEVVRNLKKEDGIDRGYYDHLVNEAYDEIAKYGDAEWFINGVA